MPWEGAPWPASYQSTASPDTGAALLLRLYARDTNQDVDGNPIPGHLVSVEIRGPAVDPATGGAVLDPDTNQPAIDPATGALQMAETWTTITDPVAGTEDAAGAQFQGMWRLPNDIPAGTTLRFEMRLLDSHGTQTIVPVAMTSVAARRVYEAVQTAVLRDDPMLDPGADENGPVFLLGGSDLSVEPRDDGTVRRIPGLFIYTGASDATGSPVVQPSVLRAPEIRNYASAVLYEPLELAIGTDRGPGAVGLGFGSRIDMSNEGLLGTKWETLPGTTTKVERSMVLPGETGAGKRAGGSHGGAGWFGSISGGWNRNDLSLPGSVYDSVWDPKLPGGGGGSSDGSAGGTGGGVIRLLAPGGQVRLDGDVLAEGGSGTTSTTGGGAGGAVRIVASHLTGRGRISVAGGHGGAYNTTGGGGGGRVSLSYQSVGRKLDLEKQVVVSGGSNDGSANANRRAGAGTLFLEQVDAAGAPTAPGTLSSANPLDPQPVALTPLRALAEGSVVAVTADSSTVLVDLTQTDDELHGRAARAVRLGGIGSRQLPGRWPATDHRSGRSAARPRRAHRRGP